MAEAPRTPANVEPYVRALGVDGAVDFLLEYGGAPMAFAPSPTARSRVVQTVGMDGALALHRELGLMAKVPVAKRWLAQYLRKVRGVGMHEIARRMHVTEVTVRAWVNDRREPNRQLSMFPDQDTP